MCAQPPACEEFFVRLRLSGSPPGLADGLQNFCLGKANPPHRFLVESPFVEDESGFRGHNPVNAPPSRGQERDDELQSREQGQRR
jgi:hypothetical protein